MNRYHPEGAGPGSDSNIDASQLFALAIPIAVCCALILTSTVSIFPELPSYDTKRIAQFILLTFGCFTALIHPGFRHTFAAQMARIPGLAGLGIVLFFVLGFTSSAVNSESLRGLIYSLIDVGLLGLLLVFTVIVAASREIAGHYFDRVVISLLALLGLAVGVQEITGYFAARSVGSSFSFDIALIHFGFPRIYNQLQTWTIPVLAALPYLFPRNRLAAVICVIALGLNWYVLLTTGARGSIVALLAAFSIAAVISPSARKAIIKWQSAGILLGALIYAVLLMGTEAGADRPTADLAKNSTVAGEMPRVESGHVRKNSSKPPKSNSFYERSVGRPLLHTTGRTRLWQSALDNGLEHPFLGIGPMNFACKGPPLRVGSPHNLALQIFSEWGIPAALILGLLGLWLLGFLVKNLANTAGHDEAAGNLRLMLLVSVLAALIHMSVSSLLIAPMSQLLAALIGGWLMGVLPRNLPRGTAGARVRPTAAILGVCALCSLLLLPFAYHEMVRMPSYVQQLPIGEEGRPRLWQLARACSDKIR